MDSRDWLGPCPSCDGAGGFGSRGICGDCEGSGDISDPHHPLTPRHLPPDLTAHPVTLYMCGTCDHWHCAGYGGDCRDDSERFTDEQRDSVFGAEGEGWCEAESVADLTAPCRFCGRDNTGHEGEPCADECPQYWEARGVAHPDYPGEQLADLTAHPLAFGGLALVPVSDAGRDWLFVKGCDVQVFADWHVFTPAFSACMTGFPADAIGFEPQDWPEIVRAAKEAGLIVEGC